MTTAQRITEATTTLVLRQGYDKTTMQDIAAEAGIARSTIYTKWKTKEALFTDLLWLESSAYLDTWLELVERDPEGGSLRGIYHNALVAVRERPFILALYTQNQFVLGNFVQQPMYAQAMSGLLLWNARWLETLQANGLIRADLEIEATAWIEVIFRQGLLTIPIDMDAHPTISYETILDQFFSMFGQFVGTSAAFTSDAGKVALRDYITTFKAQYAPDNQ